MMQAESTALSNQGVDLLPLGRLEFGRGGVEFITMRDVSDGRTLLLPLRSNIITFADAHVRAANRTL
tara:strand:- start:1951 stop:2151 length:201 start_codon:yes stop_codon:yes gene_type:complete